MSKYAIIHAHIVGNKYIRQLISDTGWAVIVTLKKNKDLANESARNSRFKENCLTVAS